MPLTKRRLLKVGTLALTAVGISTVTSSGLAQDETAKLISYSTLQGRQRNSPTVAISVFQGNYVASVTVNGQTRRYSFRIGGDETALQSAFENGGRIQVGDQLYKVESQQRGNTVLTRFEGINNSESGEVSTQIFGGIGIAIALAVAGLMILASLATVIVGLVIQIYGGDEENECTVDVRDDGGGDGFVADPYCDEQIPPLQC